MKQAEALEILKSGASVFLTGEAGSGKSYTVEQYWNRKKKIHECCGSTRSFYHLKGCKACKIEDYE